MRWIEYTKLSNGQSAVICFDKNYRHEIGSGYDYAVAFAIANKKKVFNRSFNMEVEEAFYDELIAYVDHKVKRRELGLE